MNTFCMLASTYFQESLMFTNVCILIVKLKWLANSEIRYTKHCFTTDMQIFFFTILIPHPLLSLISLVKCCSVVQLQLYSNLGLLDLIHIDQCSSEDFSYRNPIIGNEIFQLLLLRYQTTNHIGVLFLKCLLIAVSFHTFYCLHRVHTKYIPLALNSKMILFVL